MRGWVIFSIYKKIFFTKHMLLLVSIHFLTNFILLIFFVTISDQTCANYHVRFATLKIALKGFNSVNLSIVFKSWNVSAILVEKPQMKKISFQKTKTLISILYLTFFAKAKESNSVYLTFVWILKSFSCFFNI